MNQASQPEDARAQSRKEGILFDRLLCVPFTIHMVRSTFILMARAIQCAFL